MEENKIKFEFTLEKRKSKSNDKIYYCLVNEDLEKIVFLSPLEMKLVKYIIKEQNVNKVSEN